MDSATPISTSEYQGVFPFIGLSIVYWWRDRYFFNRGRSVSSVQWQVLFVLYPIWSFLEWSSSLQISRGSWYFIGLSTIGRTLVGHYTTIAIFNDGFVQTRQQALSFFVTLFISYMWAILSVLMYSTGVPDPVECSCQSGPL